MFPSPTKTFHNDGYAAIKPTRPELSTKGKNILITGGGAGIGRHIADGFAQSGAAAIALVGRTESVLSSSQKELSSAYPGTKVYSYQASVEDLASVTSAFSKFAEDVGGKIDVLVSNVGYGPDWTTLADANPDDWWKSYEVNVRGTFNVVKAFLPVAATNATAINVTTAAAGMPFIPNASGYASAKLAACKVWEYLGQENPSFTVISFHPGVIEGTVTSEKAIKQGVNMPADNRKLECPSSKTKLTKCSGTAQGLCGLAG